MQKGKTGVTKTKKRGYAGPQLRNCSIYISAALIKKVDERAEKEGVTRSWEIEQLLREVLTVKEEKGDLTGTAEYVK